MKAPRSMSWNTMRRQARLYVKGRRKVIRIIGVVGLSSVMTLCTDTRPSVLGLGDKAGEFTDLL